MSFVSLIPIAACGTTAQPTKPEPSVVSEPEPVPNPGLPSPGHTCLPADEFGFVLDGSIRGSRFVYCRGGACVEHDLATNRAIPVAHRPDDEPQGEAPTSGPHWRIDADAQALHVCTTADSTSATAKCVRAALGGLGFVDVVAPSASPDGSRVVVVLGQKKIVEGSQLTVALFDTRSGKLLATDRVDDPSLMCGTARFVGPSVLVALDVCAGPGGDAWLADPRSLARIAPLGPEDFGRYDPDALPLHPPGSLASPGLLAELGTEWAFLEQGAASVLVQDVSTGRVIARHDLRQHYPHDSDSDSYEVPPMGGSMHRLESGELLVSLAETRSGTFVVLDLAAGREVKVQTIGTCGRP